MKEDIDIDDVKKWVRISLKGEVQKREKEERESFGFLGRKFRGRRKR